MPRRSGFTLIEAAVAIAVVAVLAGLMAPLAVKALNQQREARTREGLKLAFEALAGARDRRVPSLRADTGYTPTVSLADLRSLVANPVGAPAYGYNGQQFFWGWNGPYWQGSLDVGNRPLDGWGSPIRFQVAVASGITTWQVRSSGADRIAGTADDLAYPTVPASALSYNATLLVTVAKTGSATNTTGRIALVFPNGAGGVTTSPGGVAPNILNNNTPQTFSWNVAAGGMQLDVIPSGGGNFTEIHLALDLLPGETRQLDLVL